MRITRTGVPTCSQVPARLALPGWVRVAAGRLPAAGCRLPEGARAEDVINMVLWLVDEQELSGDAAMIAAAGSLAQPPAS